MKLDKKYLLNYIVSAIFLIVAVVFFYNLSAKIFGLDLLKPKHLYKLFKMIVTGKMFINLHNFSIFISFIGFIFVLVGGFKLSMDIEYQKDENLKESENTINQTVNDFDTAIQNVENKEVENTTENINENVKNDTTEPEKIENKFAMYDKPKEENVVKNPVLEIKEEEKEPVITQEKTEQPQTKEEKKQETIDFKIDEDLEREKVKNKIQEMINKMEDKNKKESDEEQKNTDNTEPEKEQVKEKLLSKFDMSKIKGMENTNTNKEFSKVENNEILTAEKMPEQMNYETITEEQNTIFESVLIDAGFKLLSEIRIGNTGIDYLGISKEQVAIIQVDTKEGKWVANEDLIGENKYPLWYSESGNKISPFYRVVESVNTVKSLFKDIDIPVNGYICLTNNTIVNMSEAEEIAEKQNIKILKLSDFDGNEFIDSLDDEFETESLTEPDTKTLDKMIEILEQAEIPE